QIQRVAALNAQECGVLAGRARRVVLARVGHDLKLRWHARERATQLVQVGLEGARAIRRLAQRIGGDHPSGAADPRLADAWKIDLTEERAPQRRAMTLGQI